MQYFFLLLWAKAMANVRTEVSRYYLNYLWWVLEPLLTMATFYIVFGIFLNSGTDDYLAFLLTGLVSWQWFANGVTQSSESIVANRGMMLQVNIAKIFFPLETIVRGTFKHLFVLALLLIFLVFYPTPVTMTWLALPLIMFIQLLFIVGFGLICAMVVPFVPDLRFVIATGVRLAMFGSGVFYSIDSVVLPQHRFIMYLNPMAGLIKNYREILMYGRWPDWLYLGYLAIAGAALLVCAVWGLRKLDHVYPRICQQ